MKKIFIIVFLSCTSFLYSQEDYVKDKWKVKFAYFTHNTGAVYNNASGSKSVYTTNFQAELSYGILNYLETGIYFGYALKNSKMILNDRNLTFGLNANFHFLQFITQGKLLKHLDTYIATNIGSNHHKTDDLHDYTTQAKVRDGANTFYLECGIGGGVAVYPTKKLGIFTEYLFGKYFNQDNKRFKVGLIYRF